jgi:tRNA(fMet)-specific endonuclease VapC
MRYLLDTNIVSDFIRYPKGLTAARIRELGPPAVCTSIIVAAELRFGALKRRAPRLLDRIEVTLATVAVLPFAAPADIEYARVRSELERQGKPIGGNDLFIAAHALALNCRLVTANEREFTRIEGLVCENWLRQSAIV